MERSSHLSTGQRGHDRLKEESWNKGNLSVLDELLASTYIEHDPSAPGGALDFAGFKQNLIAYRTAFPDVHFTLDECCAIGDDRVLVRWTARGTHTEPLLNLPITGKLSTVTGMTLARYETGKGVAAYTNWDTLGMMQQLGAIPAAPQPSMSSQP